ncbi:MAG: segregation and condensation protein A [Eubacteriales bacterium]
MDYKIQLHEFEGPMDLLLHLITKNEIDIFDIPISKITQQYIEYINQFKEYNMELSSEFIVLAAQLIQIKSKLLLPPEENEEGEEIDPREELAQKIYEYKIFKEISDYLKKKEDNYLKIYYKDPDYMSNKVASVTHINIGQLTKAFKRVLSLNNMAMNIDVRIHKIEREVIRLEDKIVEIQQMLNVNSKIQFTSLFSQVKTKNNIIVTFLAILELIKNNIIGFEQLNSCGEIVIYKL